MKTFMPDLPLKERQILLSENADKVETTTYFKPLSQEELDLRREKLTDNAITLSEYEDQKKEIMDDFKEKMKPLAEENKQILTEVKTRQAKVEGTLYHLANHDEGFMETYDEQGELVSSRRLRPDEKQQKLFSITKTA